MSEFTLVCPLKVIFIRLEAMLWPNIGFTGNFAVFTRSAITPTKVNRLG